MEKYSQDLGFYCRKESLSLVAGKILTALQCSHAANISEIHGKNTFSVGDYVRDDKSDVTALPEKHEISTSPMTTNVFTDSVMDQNHFQLLAAPPVTQVEPIQKQRSTLSVLDDINYENKEGSSCATLRLKSFLSPKPKSCFSENEVTRKLLGKQHKIFKSDEIQFWSMSSEQQCTLLEDTNQTKAVILTMVFQNGSSQLCPSKDSNASLSGILILFKRQGKHETLNPSESDIYDQEDLYIFMDITDTALLRKDHAQYNFLRKILPLILHRKTPVICFNAKEFLRTIVHIYGKVVNWKNVSQCVILDPRIAAWLLNPADCNPSFEDLVKIHCERVEKTTDNSPRTQHRNTCKRLNILYNLMVKLQHKLQAEELWDLFCTIELPLTTILAVMENNTIQVNEDELKKTSVLLGIHLKELEREAHHAAGEKFRLTSSNELRQVLFEKLHLHQRCKTKLPRTNLCHLPSTAEPTLHQLEDLHPLPRIILQFRQVQKIKSTFVDGLWSCITKNIQGVSKLPIQFEMKQYVQGKAKEIVTINPRSMFISAKGHTFLAADFSQIELRLLAHFSSDPELLLLFNEMKATDIFTSLASQWKNVEYKNISQADREQAKRVVYSVIYGVGKERLSQSLGITRAEANTLMEHFLQKYRVSDFTQKVIEQCHSKGFVVTLMGRKRPLPLINSKNYSLRAQAERQAVNFVIQGSAADLCKLAMITISSSITSSLSLTSRIIAQIHDELLFEVEDSQLQEFAALVKHIMESLQHADGVGIKVPLKVTLSCGKSWGCMTELEVK